MGQPFRKPQINRFSKAKLIGSKWTRLQTGGKEKHFMVQKWDPDREEARNAVVIEAVLTRRMDIIAVDHLKDPSQWRMGWH
jgi:tryptophan-rich hypothetical protein